MNNNYLKRVFDITRYNIGTVITFELLYKLLLALILMPLAGAGFNFTMKVTGYTYLTLENIFSFILNPLTFILLLLIVIFLTIITMFDISTLIIIFDESNQHRKIGMIDAIKISIKKSKILFKPQNITVAFLVLFLIPFLNIGIGSNVISSISIPEFIMDYITTNSFLSILLFLVYIFLTSLLMNWIYSMHYMVLEDKDFKEARNSSKNLINHNIMKDMIKIYAVQTLLSLVYIFLILIGVTLIVFLNKILSSFQVVESVFITLIWLFIGISLVVSVVISNAVSYGVISALYYEHKVKKKEKIKSIDYETVINNKKTNNILKHALILFISLGVVGGSVFTYQVVTGKANLNIEYIREMELTAHRGASVDYPENTMSAFQGAKELGADWIELDVQQTKDKKIVVSHDSNLSRVTGVNKDIINLTYEEIEKLDAGSFFNKKFKDEKIPLLEEVVEFAKENNIRLNIELKPTGLEKNFEQDVLDIINKYDFKDRCVITSQTYSVLEKVKKIDSSFKTVYVMSIAIGNITDLSYADAFSVEATNVTSNLVNKVHNAGKELYSWTVNTEESINKMIDMGVDNIITDNIPLGKELLMNSKSSNIIKEFMKALE